MNPLWTFVLEAERGGRSTLVERFGCQVLEESLHWMPSVDESDLSEADKTAWRTHLRELAPYILARVGADRVEEMQARRDAARLRRLILALEPVSHIRLKCSLDGQDLFLNAMEREAFVEDGGSDGGMLAFVRWGEGTWPPTEDDAEALATVFGEVLGPGYFESFLALIRAPSVAKREHLLRRAGAPTDISERRALLFEDNLSPEDQSGSTDNTASEEPKTITSHHDSEQPAQQPQGPTATGDQPKQSPLYSQDQLLVDGSPILLSGRASATNRHRDGNQQSSSNDDDHNPNGESDTGGGYGGHTDLDRLNALGMAIVIAYELARLRKAGSPGVTAFDRANPEPQPDAVVFDVSTPSNIAEARARCSHFDAAFHCCPAISRTASIG